MLFSSSSFVITYQKLDSKTRISCKLLKRKFKRKILALLINGKQKALLSGDKKPAKHIEDVTLTTNQPCKGIQTWKNKVF